MFQMFLSHECNGDQRMCIYNVGEHSVGQTLLGFCIALSTAESQSEVHVSYLSSFLRKRSLSTGRFFTVIRYF